MNNRMKSKSRVEDSTQHDYLGDLNETYNQIFKTQKKR